MDRFVLRAEVAHGAWEEMRLICLVRQDFKLVDHEAGIIGESTVNDGIAAFCLVSISCTRIERSDQIQSNSGFCRMCFFF